MVDGKVSEALQKQSLLELSENSQSLVQPRSNRYILLLPILVPRVSSTGTDQLQFFVRVWRASVLDAIDVWGIAKDKKFTLWGRNGLFVSAELSE
jgi:hypothetical protein